MNNSKKKSKRILIISDMHCGHQTGLTCPDWQYQESKNDVAKKNKYARVQKECWIWFSKEIKNLGKIDLLIINGDAIDGNGYKSGGTEQITTDREKQCSMAIEIINFINADKIIMTSGTAYHTGEEEDFEEFIAREVHAKFGSHEWVSVNNVVFDIKHKVGSSSIPHGRFTSIARENLWSKLWAERELIPKSQILIRSHIHYFTFQGDGSYLAMSTPALQGMGTKFGSRICSGFVDYGFIYFDINSDGHYDWHVKLADVKSHKVNPIYI